MKRAHGNDEGIATPDSRTYGDDGDSIPRVLGVIDRLNQPPAFGNGDLVS